MRLLVAALDAELVAFEGELTGFDRLVTGPGKLPAAYGLTRALDAGTYTDIVVVGTAGAISDAVDGGVYDVTAAIQHDVRDLDGVVGNHISLPHRVSTGAGEGATIATGDHFVDDAGTVALIQELGATLVDMETYAYIWVAERFGVPIRVLKAVSDRAQDGATLLWDDTVAACSAQLRERIRADYGV